MGEDNEVTNFIFSVAEKKSNLYRQFQEFSIARTGE